MVIDINSFNMCLCFKPNQWLWVMLCHNDSSSTVRDNYIFEELFLTVFLPLF